MASKYKTNLSASGFALHKYADLSAEHVKLTDAQIIATHAKKGIHALGIIAVYDEGWFIYIPLDKVLFKHHLLTKKREGFSNAYLNVLKKLHKDGIPYARFDAEGYTNPNLPVFPH